MSDWQLFFFVALPMRRVAECEAELDNLAADHLRHQGEMLASRSAVTSGKPRSATW